MASLVADMTSVRAKLSRAEVHLGSFQDELSRFSKQHANAKHVEFQRDGAWHVVSVNPFPHFPPEWSLVVGDFLNNLRAALDHLIWQLVLREGEEPKQTHQFPLITSEKQFCKRVRAPKKNIEGSPLYGIPVDGDAWAIIEQSQPWYRGKTNGYAPRQDQLAQLARMTNIDKHRTLLLSLPLPVQGALAAAIAWEPVDVQPIAQRLPRLGFASFEQPTEVVRYRFPPESDIRMYMKSRLPVAPTFGDENTQVGGVNTFLALVHSIVEQVAALPRVQG